MQVLVEYFIFCQEEGVEVCLVEVGGVNLKY